ncbi:MAG: porin [Rhodospirillales bacterium]|nr:MAG: porin [Rhodospirillales bacterium]
MPESLCNLRVKPFVFDLGKDKNTMMKKFLAGTTALIAVGSFASAANAAEPIKLSVGGFMNQWVSIADVDAKNTNQNGQVNWEFNNVAVNSDTEVHFKGETVLDNGLKVAVVIEKEAERTDTGANGRNADQQYAEISGGWGAVRVGETLNAATRVHSSAPGAGAGVSDAVTVLGVGVASGNAVTDLASQVTSVDGINDAGAGSTAIDYVSPMFGPFAFGITYTPRVFSRGLAQEGTTSKDLLGAALVYADKWGPVAVNADVAYARFEQLEGSAQNGMAHGVPVGIKLGYAGFEVGGSYFRIMDNAKIASTATGTSYDGVAWDAGIAYTTGDWKFGYQYYSSSLEGSLAQRGRDTTKVHNVGMAYTMGPGVSVSANLSHLTLTEETRTSSDKTTAAGLITGIQLAF